MIGQGEYRLVEAIVEELTSHTRIRELTGHTDQDPRIAEEYPNVQAKTPFIGVRVHRTSPMNSNAPMTGLRRSQVKICAYSKEQLDSIHIIDYVEALALGTHSSLEANRRYWDISNDYIQNPMTTYIQRHTLMPVEDYRDTWENSIMIEIIWIDKTCTPPPCGTCLPNVNVDDSFDCSEKC